MEGFEGGQPQQIIDWKNHVREQGITTDLPPNFLEKIYQPENTRLDALTGLPIEDDEMRHNIIEKLAESIKNNKSFVCIYADVDNLKVANNKDRKLGDEIIKADAAKVCATVDGSIIEETTVFVVRQTQAADETVVWLFDLTDEQLEETERKASALNRDEKVINIGADSESFIVSTTAAILTSKDEEIKEILTQTRAYLNQNNDNLPFDLYNEIKERADNQTKQLKIEKDIKRIPIEQLVQNVDQIITILTDRLGGTRISAPLLQASYRMVENMAYIKIAPPEQKRTLIIEKINTLIGSSFDFEGFDEVELLVIYFDALIQKAYERAGHKT